MIQLSMLPRLKEKTKISLNPDIHITLLNYIATNKVYNEKKYI